MYPNKKYRIHKKVIHGPRFTLLRAGILDSVYLGILLLSHEMVINGYMLGSGVHERVVS